MPVINDKITRANRKASAQERSAKYASLTKTDRLQVLDKRLGKGKGASKERARLAAA